MKKIILIALITLASCSGDDDSNSTCNCIGEWSGNDPIYTEYNCDTGEPTYNPYADPNSAFLGCQD